MAGVSWETGKSSDVRQRRACHPFFQTVFRPGSFLMKLSLHWLLPRRFRFRRCNQHRSVTAALWSQSCSLHVCLALGNEGYGGGIVVTNCYQLLPTVTNSNLWVPWGLPVCCLYVACPPAHYEALSCGIDKKHKSRR